MVDGVAAHIAWRAAADTARAFCRDSSVGIVCARGTEITVTTWRHNTGARLLRNGDALLCAVKPTRVPGVP
eukprot:gene12005-biopygen5040